MEVWYYLYKVISDTNMARMLKDLKVLIDKSSGDLMEASIEKSIDCREMACPYPSFETVKAMNALGAGSVLEIVTDSNESALKSIPAVCENRNWELLVLEESKDLWRLRVRK